APPVSERLDRRDFLERAALVAGTVGIVPRWTVAGSSDPRLKELARSIQGRVVAPGDSGYRAARILYNPRFDGLWPRAVRLAGRDSGRIRCNGGRRRPRARGWGRLRIPPAGDDDRQRARGENRHRRREGARLRRAPPWRHLLGLPRRGRRQLRDRHLLPIQGASGWQRLLLHDRVAVGDGSGGDPGLAGLRAARAK